MKTEQPDWLRIVRDKVENGNATGASVMIVNDTGCAMNIGGACHRYGAKFRPVHLVELLASAIRKGDGGNGN